MSGTICSNRHSVIVLNDLNFDSGQLFLSASHVTPTLRLRWLLLNGLPPPLPLWIVSFFDTFAPHPVRYGGRDYRGIRLRRFAAILYRDCFA